MNYVLLFLWIVLLSSCSVVNNQNAGNSEYKKNAGNSEYENLNLSLKKQFFLKKFNFVPDANFEHLFIDEMHLERARIQSLPIQSFTNNRNIERSITYLEKHISNRSIWPYYIEWMSSFDGEHGYLFEYFIYWLMYSDNVSYKDYSDFISELYAFNSRISSEQSMRNVTDYILNFVISE